MITYIDAQADPVKLGNFTFTAGCSDYFEEMDGCGDDAPAIWGYGQILVYKDGEFVGEFNHVDIAFAADGFDYCIDDCCLTDKDGEELDDEEVFGELLPQVHQSLLNALYKLTELIHPECEEILKELANEG